jgi:tetrahydromethanopterin S-methyltransferase subunit G
LISEEHSRGYAEIRERLTFLDQKVDRFREELAARIDALDQKVSRQFIWLVGIQITVLVAVVGALIAALFRG